MVELKMNFTTTTDLNTNGKNSLPIAVRIYQLKNQESFLHATFRELWKDDKRVLANDLLEFKEIKINPASIVFVNLAINHATRFLGIIAIFRNPEHAQWRVLKRISSHYYYLPTTLHVQLSGNTLQVDST